MESSTETKRLLQALHAAQKEGIFVLESKENSHLRTRYADLSAVLVAIKPVFEKHGLSITQFPGKIGEAPSSKSLLVSLDNMIFHGESGEWMRSTMEIPIPEPIMSKGGGSVVNLAQRYGSGLTYARRYAYLAILGIASGDDDDAASAWPRHHETLNQPQPPPANATWFELYTSGVWRDAPVPGVEGETLGTASDPVALNKKMAADARAGGLNAALMARAAYMIHSGLVRRKLEYSDLARPPMEWDIPKDFKDLTPSMLLEMVKAVSALPEPEKDPA